MRDLVGKATLLDAEVSQSLRVISQFDDLTKARVGTEALLRAAAGMTGCPVGARIGGDAVSRVAADGRRTKADTVPDGAHLFANGEIDVWIERDGPAGTNDDLVLERLALAIGVLHMLREQSRPAPALSLADLITPGTVPSRRTAAIEQLGLHHASHLWVVATSLTEPVRPGSTVAEIDTSVGRLRACLVRSADDLRHLQATRAGVSDECAVDGLPDAWESAVTALRMTSARTPLLRAQEVGCLLLLGRLGRLDPSAHPDVLRLKMMCDEFPWGEETAEALVAADTQRAVATALGVHHSTVQSRLARLEHEMGFDCSAAPGRTRLVVALAVLRLGRALADARPTGV